VNYSPPEVLQDLVPEIVAEGKVWLQVIQQWVRYDVLFGCGKQQISVP